MAASWSLRLATEFRMPRSYRVLMRSAAAGRTWTSPPSSRIPSQTVLSKSHTTHLTWPFFGPAGLAWPTATLSVCVLISIPFWSWPALAEPLASVVRDELFKNLRAALDDLHHLGVPEVARHVGSRRASPCSLYLHGVGRGPHGGGRREVLGVAGGRESRR